MESITSFGYWVRRRRKALDLTQAALAQRVGCATVTIKKIERDERRPSRQMVDLLAEHLVIPEAERADFVRRARGKFISSMPSPVKPVPPPTFLPARLPVPRHNLPAQPTPFIGREQELVDLARLIRHEPDCRLLTLIGPGGVGKTRLALQAAAETIEAFPNGVFFVALAPISAVESLVTSIVDALNLAFYGSADPQDQLLNYLREKAMLLVLDNFEHLLPEQGADLLSEILIMAPQVKLLVTSRERLSLQEEWTFDVPGLPFPLAEAGERPPSISPQRGKDDSTPPPLGGAEGGYSALQLFEQRARQVQATFDLAAEYPAVVRICQLVVGMPLGIELAAAWTRMMSCREIAQEIERNLDFLATPLRNVSERHQSLRAVFRHSWQLLSEEEQVAFRKLSLFRGGFLAEAAEPVAGASLPILAALVDKSLPRRTRAGRYDLHELLRQYAAEKLEAVPGESDKAQDRHADYYATFLRQRTYDLRGLRQKDALAEISADIDNVRAAWQWAIEHRNIEAIGKSLDSFLRTNRMSGWFREGELAFRRAVAGLSGAETVADIKEMSFTKDQKIVLGQLLVGQGVFCVRLGLNRQARDLAQLGVALLRQVGSEAQWELADCLLGSGFAEHMQGKHTEAKQLFQDSLALFTEVRDHWGIGTALMMLGQVKEHQGLYVEAQKLLQESSKVLKQVGDLRNEANCLDYLGYVARELGTYPQAQQYFKEARKNRREIGDREGTIISLKALGDLDRIMGRYARAKLRFEESLTLAREIGYSKQIADSLDGLGAVARLQGKYGQAEQLHEESLAIYKEMRRQRFVSVCLNNLGRLAYDKGEYQQAKQFLQESLALCQQNDYEREMLSCLHHLGFVACAGGRARQQEASQYFSQALELATKIRAVPTVLDSMVGLAILLAQTGNKPRAVELLTLALHHPGSEQETKDRAVKLQAELVAELPPEEVASAEARGQALDLWATVKELLAEIPGLGGDRS